MPSFTFLGRFRIGQWKEFRKFILEERRDAALRIGVIQAELGRIGKIDVGFQADETGAVSEKRAMLYVRPLSSSLGKLLQAYTGMGGNPWDISMFLTPGSIAEAEDGTLVFTQPSGGVLHAKTGQLAFSGTLYQQGVSTLYKYNVNRVGGRRELNNEADATQISRGRRWVEQEIRFKRNALEERIIKLCDLREQLLDEMDAITCAVAETAGLQTVYSPEGVSGPEYARDSSVASIVNRFDGIIWQLDTALTEDGLPTVATSVAANTFNAEGLAGAIHIMSDAPDGEEDGSAL
jgi:hypothetical protein|tara:strand:+ start:796 stop:1671 length:876 start_codon:yes stop_codon:yes gene_type:complete